MTSSPTAPIAVPVDAPAHHTTDLTSPGFSSSLSADEFKALFRGHPGGVAVITADAGDGPVALTATSVASVSAEPPLLIFSVAAVSSTTAVLAKAETVVVHLLDAHDLDLARLGATSGVDRFAWVRCAVIERMDAGGSTVFAAHALQSQLERDVAPGEPGDALVYHNRTWHRLGELSRIS